MATKSIFKTVNVRNASLSRRLLNALEQAKDFSEKETKMSKSYTSIGKDDVKKLFGEEDDGV